MAQHMKPCAICEEGAIENRAEPGRIVTHHGLRLEIPATVEIPTCNHCGERFYNDDIAKRVDAALDEELQARRLRVIRIALKELERLTTRSRIESLLDISPGYLSKIMNGKKPVTHRMAVLLDTLAQEPGKNLERTIRAFEDDETTGDEMPAA